MFGQSTDEKKMKNYIFLSVAASQHTDLGELMLLSNSLTHNFVK